MALAPTNDMTRDELVEYIEKLEDENRGLRAKTDNRKKLTGSEVRTIRQLAETGVFTQEEIAGEFGINPATVSRTVRRKYHAAV